MMYFTMLNENPTALMMFPWYPIWAEAVMIGGVFALAATPSLTLH